MYRNQAPIYEACILPDPQPDLKKWLLQYKLLIFFFGMCSIFYVVFCITLLVFRKIIIKPLIFLVSRKDEQVQETT